MKPATNESIVSLSNDRRTVSERPERKPNTLPNYRQEEIGGGYVGVF